MSKKKLTPKQRVRREYPNATVFGSKGVFHVVWYPYAYEQPPTMDQFIPEKLGKGNTKLEAWKNAARGLQ